MGRNLRSQNPEQYGEGYNYYNALLRVAPIQDYSLNLSSSKDNFSTTAVLGYFKQDGVVINSNYKRYSLRLNSEYRITDKIKAGFNVAPTYSLNNSPNTDGQFWASGLVNNSLLTWPIFPFKNTDGTLPLMSWDPTISAFPTPNYYRAAQEIINETKNTRLLANTFIQYEPVAGLVLKSTLNFDLGNTKYKNIVPSTTSAGFATVLPTTSSATFRSSQYLSWLNENTITYTKSLNDHHFDILGGYTIQNFRSDIQQIAVTGFPDDRVPTVGAAANINRSGTTNTYNDIQEWSMMSYLARINYNFKNKYLFSAAVRSDGSSRFGSDKRWGTFPSLSAGWIVSEEGFMKDNNVISLLKLRASYGLVGNNNIGNYTQYATVSSGSSGYNSIFGTSLASGSAITSMPNSILTWEQSQEMDFGFDLGLFRNRLNFGYDYYTRRTKSLLYSVNVAQESGFASYMGNIGELQFWGHEITINSQNIVGSFKWSTDFNISFTDNKVNKLTGLIDRIYGDGTITKVGQKIGLFYGMIHDGVYVDQADFDSSPKATLSEVGTVKFRDVGGGPDGAPDGKITNGGDNDDRTIIGDPTPKFIFGITNNFSYKNFDLSIVMAGSYGNDIVNMSEQGLTNLDGVFNVLSEVKYRWRSAASPGVGKYGKTSSGTAYERDWVNSRFVSDASYLSIKNITLGYTIPKSKLKYVGDLRLYISVQNLHVFTNYKGVNPEITMDAFGGGSNALNLGHDYGGYPVPRTISFGVNLTL
jgi:TonB-linked SusC/RagA family outer membrane protein